MCISLDEALLGENPHAIHLGAFCSAFAVHVARPALHCSSQSFQVFLALHPGGAQLFAGLIQDAPFRAVDALVDGRSQIRQRARNALRCLPQCSMPALFGGLLLIPRTLAIFITSLGCHTHGAVAHTCAVRHAEGEHRPS